MTHDRGSVLVEALVSTAIVAAVIATMLNTIREADARRTQIEARRYALMIARSELAAVGAEIPLQPGQVRGVEGDFVWSVRIEPGATDTLSGGLAPPPSIVSVDVRASSGGEPLASLRTLRVSPSQ